MGLINTTTGEYSARALKRPAGQLESSDTGQHTAALVNHPEISGDEAKKMFGLGSGGKWSKSFLASCISRDFISVRKGRAVALDVDWVLAMI